MRRKQKTGGKALAWHPAFVEALQMELREYRDVLEFKAEHQLTAEPLKIDCVIIKKDKDVVIHKKFAAIFRQQNILEYKSPSDYVSVADFYKVHAYACLYAVLRKVPIKEMTASFVESRYPRKLLKHIRQELGYTVEKSGGGIYTISGGMMPMQVIDSSQLPEAECLWLKNLSNRLDRRVFGKIGAKALQYGEDAQIAAYFDIIKRANMQAFKEALKMSEEDELELEQIYEELGWIAKWEAKGEARGRAEGRAYEANVIAQNMVNLGLPLATIVSATRLEPEKVQALYATAGA